MYKNLLKLFLVLSLIHTTTFAQQFNWVKTLSHQPSLSPHLREMVSDNQGSLYMIGLVTSWSGLFNGETFDLNPGTGTTNINLEAGTSYVAKYDSIGNFIWGSNYKNVTDLGHVTPNYIKVNPVNGDVYVLGYFSDTCNFDFFNNNNPAAIMTTPDYSVPQSFVAVYTSNGVFKSVHKYEIYSGYVHSDGQAYNGSFTINGAEFDKNGRLVVFGNAIGYVNVDLYGGAGIYGSGYESIVIYYDQNLNLSSLFTAGENYAYTIMDLEPDQFNSWYLLLKSNHPQLDYEMGIIKTDTAGFIKWEKYTPMSYAANVIIASEYTAPEMIKIDSRNNVYVTGRFKGTLDLNLDPIATNVINNSANNIPTGFIVRYDSAGTYKWAYKISGQNATGSVGTFMGMSVNNRDELALALMSNQNAYIDFKQNTIDTSGSFIFIVDSMANLVSYNAIRATNNSSEYYIGSLSTYKNKIRFNGKLYDSTVFQQGVPSSVVNMPTNQSWTYFTEFNSCKWAVTHVNASICSGESYVVNGQTFTQSGNYTISIPLSSGCDSVISLSLNVLPVIDTTVVVNAGTLQAVANNPAYSYQWIDCNTNQEVAGANSRTFTASAQGGTYRVKITNGNCVFESGCHTITPTSVKEVALSNIASVFPNPVNDKLGIVFNSTTYVSQISITNLAGISLWESKLNQSIKTKDIDVSTLPAGSYIISIIANDKQYIQKFAKY
ncbi:MAG: hypothetical protein BGO31_03900 [Bacteroidetes bacterium 43-16]|nr:MAG: hypothetical protein BGO31_03900 [Bacteroidetes bacterium 43-16]